MNNKLKFLVILGVCAFTCPNSWAITLDSFAFTEFRRVDLNPGMNFSEVLQGQGAFGGTRSVEVQNTSNGSYDPEFTPGERIGQNFGAFALNPNLGGSGNALLTYDGDNEVGLTSFDNFVLDLTQSGATQVEFLALYDFEPPQNPFEVEFTFYDASDATGNTFSQGSVFITENNESFANPSIFALAFADLNRIGSNGAADLANIGAFSIGLIGENALSSEFAIANVQTNEVPEPGTMMLLGASLLAGARRKYSKS